MKLKVVIVALVILGLSACNKEGKKDPDKEFDRKAMLLNLTSNLIKPSYEVFNNSVEELEAAVTTFNTTPNATNLVSLRNSWKTALINWQSVGSYEFGPAGDVLLRDNLNLYPTDTTLLKSNIAIGSYNLSTASNYAAKGFQALDYLLYGIAETDADIIALFSTDSLAQSRKNYLTALIADIKTATETTVSNWNTYDSTFVNSTGTDVGSSTSLLLNAYTKYWEVYVRDGKLGIPAGARSFSGTPLPEKVEAYYYNQFSIELCIKATENLKKIYLGDTGQGFDDYLVFTNGSEVNENIKTQFDLVINKLKALNEPLTNEVVNNQAAVTDVFNEMQKLTLLLKVDLPAALGVLITYTDNDGD